MNTVTVVGNITRDPELRFFDSGSVVNTSIAVNESFKAKNGEWKETVAFIDLSIWENAGGENVAECLKKGDRVLVTGKLKMNQWKTDAGENRTKLELTVFEIGPTMKWAEVEITKNPKKGFSQTANESTATYTTDEPDF
jgi:single-strand DNA-binding protein